MNNDIAGVLDFLRAAEALKTVPRSGWTSAGERESVAEHTWRLCLMALAFHPHFPEVDFARLVKICVVHDLGEAVGGDVPAPEQARRAAAGAAGIRTAQPASADGAGARAAARALRRARTASSSGPSSRRSGRQAASS